MSLTSENNFNILKSILSKHPLMKINKELLFEHLRYEILEMDKNKDKYNNLLDMNKKIIYNMNKINTLSTIKIKPNKKISNFDLRLKEHQNEFNSYNNSKPPEINFKDNDELNNYIPTIDETLEKREKELKNILKSNKKKITNNLFSKDNFLTNKIINNNEILNNEESYNKESTNNKTLNNEILSNKILSNKIDILIKNQNNIIEQLNKILNFVNKSN